MDKNKYYNLTIPQENIWTIEELNQTININSIFGTFFINKKLNIDILKLAINKIIETNDALRIRITTSGSNPVQYIAPYEYDNLTVHYLNSDNQKEIDTIINNINSEHLDILNNKLYDFRIIATPKSIYICIKMHHIIADAWSIGQVFLENIKENYRAIEEKIVVDQKPSYLDYISRNEEYKKSEKYKKDEEFWKKYTSKITYENHFKATGSKQSKRITKSLSKDLNSKIGSFCKKNNISEFAFLLGVISTYYSKIFDEKNIVIGTPFLNRQKAKKELEMMGMFVGTLPISIFVDNNLSFANLCKQISSTNMACFKHSRFPYNNIQKAYMEYSGKNTNLYEIVFSYQMNDLTSSFDETNYKTTWFSNNVQNDPLFISYVNHLGEQELCYDFLKELFEEKDIENIHNRLMVIIKQILKNQDIYIKDINILSKDDLDLLKVFNNTGDINLENETIVTRFEKIVKANRSKIALKCEDSEVSYTELDKLSNSVANEIIKMKIKKGSAIALIFDKSIKMFTAMLGVLKAGCYYVPILPQEEKSRAEFIIKNSKSVLLITDEFNKSNISNKVIENRVLINDLLHKNTDFPNVEINSTDLSYLIYTSGTTGTPKGVIIKHENVISLIESINKDKNLKFLKNDIAISLLKYSFDASAIDIYSMLLNGGKLIIVPKKLETNAILVTKLIEQEEVTRFFTVSKWIEQIQSIAKSKKINLSSLRLIGTGAEVLTPKKFQYLFETYPNLKFCNTYGPTETTVMVTSHRLTETDIQNNYSPIGKLIPFVRALVVNHSTNEVLPVNTRGELAIFEDNTSAHNISNGYFDLEEKTKENFIELYNPYTKEYVKAYKTGDYVKINKNLELDFYGRRDDFKKVNGGYLVSLTEVEKKMQNILGNAFDSCVVSVPIRNTNSIILFVSRKSKNVNISIEDIKNEIDKKITFYMRPKQIIEIESFPFTNNGKIHKHLLEDKAIEYIESKSGLTLPKGRIEQKIYNAIREIINVDFSTTDDFEDDLGIDSLNMTVLYSKLDNSKISIQDLYNYPNVKDLAHLMKKELDNDELVGVKNIKIPNSTNTMDLEKVLLTGSTGFLGVHLLRELAFNDSVKKIYCLVRETIDESNQERFEKRIAQYFDEKTCTQIKNKSIVINGDLRNKNLGLDKHTFSKVFLNVKTIINAAANVKHIGKYSTSYTDNVQTVNNLIDICLKLNISLAHMSTLSINGLPNQNVRHIFTENTLNINQTFNKNPYLISKFEAEQSILKNISENFLNARIFRIGNIMPRLSDNVFQINYDQNGFLLSINELSKLQMITKNIEDLDIALSPVDEVSQSIMTILQSSYCNTIYHIETDKTVKIERFIDLFNERNIKFQVTTQDKFDKKLKTNYSIGSAYIHSFFRSEHNKYSNQATSIILDELNFKWKPLPNEYLGEIINLGLKIK